MVNDATLISCNLIYSFSLYNFIRQTDLRNRPVNFKIFSFKIEDNNLITSLSVRYQEILKIVSTLKYLILIENNIYWKGTQIWKPFRKYIKIKEDLKYPTQEINLFTQPQHHLMNSMRFQIINFP